jgi:hypothetical protein
VNSCPASAVSTRSTRRRQPGLSRVSTVTPRACSHPPSHWSTCPACSRSTGSSLAMRSVSTAGRHVRLPARGSRRWRSKRSSRPPDRISHQESVERSRLAWKHPAHGASSGDLGRRTAVGPASGCYFVFRSLARNVETWETMSPSRVM